MVSSRSHNKQSLESDNLNQASEQPSVKPPPVMPPASPAKLLSDAGLVKNNTSPQVSFRPVGQEEELEALRQRGLAKLLNRHFTEACQKIAQEKAAAEAALRDLEGRKQQQQQNNSSNTTTMPASPNRGLSQIEELYTKVHKWRNECRQKEKETLLLYQRYVDKFGGTGHVQVPAVNESSVMAAVAASVPVVPDASSSSQPLQSSLATNNSSSAQVAASVQHLEDTLKRQRADGNSIFIPSLALLGAYESFASLNAKEEAEFRDFYRQQMERDGGTTLSSPTKGRTSSVEEGPPELHESKLATHPEEQIGNESAEEEEEEEEQDDEYDDEDDDDAHEISSLISGLTSVNSATTRQILMDCEKTVQTFLEQESKAVRTILSVAGNSRNNSKRSEHSGSNAIGSLQTQAATEAENMVKQMQGILHDFEEKQKSVPENAHQARPYYTANPEEKWMVYYDETFQREYYHEVHTNRTQWEPPSHADVTDLTSLSTVEHTASALAHVDVMPEVQKGRSLIAAYRKKSRRRRKKRLLVATAFALSVMTAGYYVYKTQPEMVESMREHVRPAESALYEWVATVRSNLLEMFAKQDSRQIVPVRVKTPQVPVPVTPTTVQRKEDEEAESLRRKLAEEAAHKRAEEARRLRHVKALEEAAAEAARLEYLRRPVGCNIPFAYLVHGRCYRLATENPPYNAFDLVQSMMQ